MLIGTKSNSGLKLRTITKPFSCFSQTLNLISNKCEPPFSAVSGEISLNITGLLISLAITVTGKV